MIAKRAAGEMNALARRRRLREHSSPDTIELSQDVKTRMEQAGVRASLVINSEQRDSEPGVVEHIRELPKDSIRLTFILYTKR